MEKTLQEMMDRRGYQRFYYHVDTMLIDHWWDTSEYLNNLQIELEKQFGPIVELVSIDRVPQELAAAAQDHRHLLVSYFKIGPLALSVRESTVAF